MTCLICKFYDPIEPEEHKTLREAGQCEESCGDRWDGHTAIRYIKNHYKNLDGWCRLVPEGKRVTSGHVCAKIEVPEFYYNPHWGLERMKPDDRLVEWARKQYSKLFKKSWQEENIEYLEEQNRELRRQLEASRRISTSRLARLQAGKQKPKPSKELVPLPQYPRLVAAE